MEDAKLFLQNSEKIKIGLEVHCQLTNLKTKLFCSCSSDYRGKEPNSNICPICLGLPGSLPKVNKKGVDDAIMVALALKSSIQEKNLFFRKNYYYPDMPKNFQISQYDKAGGVPFGIGGDIKINVDYSEKKVEIIRIQIEEDPARLVYLGTIDSSPYTYVDYNRAGIALLEIITQPMLESPKEAKLFLSKIRSILEHLDISNGSLDGAMRCDVNISLAGGKRVEVKNISSFKEVERAINYEVTRQKNIISRGFVIKKETRHWDQLKRVTISLRTKEEEEDYRYFPEPDLVPIFITKKNIRDMKIKMPELPDARMERFIFQYELPSYDASVLTSDKALADFFENCVKIYTNAKKVSNWIMSDLLRWLHEFDININESKITPVHLISMIKMIDDGIISGKIAKRVLPEIFKTGKNPSIIVDEKKLIRISSSDTVAMLVEQVFSKNEKAVHDALTDEKAVNFLVGQLMKLSEGKVDPNLANKIIRNKLNEIKN